MDPIHQFQIKNIFTFGQIGGVRDRADQFGAVHVARAGGDLRC